MAHQEATELIQIQICVTKLDMNNGELDSPLFNKLDYFVQNLFKALIVRRHAAIYRINNDTMTSVRTPHIGWVLSITIVN